VSSDQCFRSGGGRPEPGDHHGPPGEAREQPQEKGGGPQHSEADIEGLLEQEDPSDKKGDGSTGGQHSDAGCEDLPDEEGDCQNQQCQAGGGHAPNIVPDEAWLVLDRRLVPGETPESVRAELEALLERAGLDDVRVEWCRTEKAPLGTVYNAGPAEPTSIRRVVELTAEALGLPFEELCEVTGDRLGQDARYWLDSSAIKADVGWQADTDWSEGLGEMVDWGRKYLDVLKDWPTDYVLRG